MLQKFIRGTGFTESERVLAELAERSFLNLWSFPNVYRDQRANATGDGKELCDLLVVCGDQIILFSEKSIQWPDAEVPVSWCRWARKAIQSSAKQLRGAERWLRQFPDRVFLDPSCSQKIPVEIPKTEIGKIHRVLVARGAEGACRSYRNVDSETLLVRPSIKGSTHWNKDAPGFEPFCVGDIEPDDTVIHVFDAETVQILLSELDTVTDFTGYLSKREILLRSGRLNEAASEENLLAYYLTEVDDHGDHDFVLKGLGEPAIIVRGKYKSILTNPQYKAKKDEDRVSYFWDVLIENFTKHMLEGTTEAPAGFQFDIRTHEIGVRHMALQSRYARRSLGQAGLGALDRGQSTDRFFRVVLDQSSGEVAGTAFFFQTMKYLEWMVDKGGYDQYRIVRTEIGRVYAQSILVQYPRLERVIGICREPPNQEHGSSEDLIYAGQHDWTQGDIQNLEADCMRFNILKNVEAPKRWTQPEYPEVVEFYFEQTEPVAATGKNRHQKRADRWKKRRQRRR